MSFDLFAEAFDHGRAAEIARSAVFDVLRPFITVGPEEDRFCRTRTSDAGEADFYVGDSGFMVNHFSSGETFELIRLAASSNGLVLFAPGLPAMLTDADQAEHLPQALASQPAPVVIETGAEIDALIEHDSETYEHCRRRLLEGP